VKQAAHFLEVPTRGKGLYNCTREIASWVAGQGIQTGLLTVFIQHTSASLVIQENADPDVVEDLMDYMEHLVPEDTSLYRHTIEGADDMTSHIRTALTNSQLSIPVIAGRLALGTWQGIYVFEHRRIPHRRRLALHFIGE
jgi:secondary thiamine-phosphate synthase enzyme